MLACPSCAAPLDDDGICTSCGALTRGMFRGLDLGTPQIARAVANGLDFYLLLGVAQLADTRTIARRYRQLRVLFPDDPAHLAAEPARRFALLELAGRVLTDPQLRATYDEMRASNAPVTNTVLRCAGCAAPLPQAAQRCSFCGMPAPATPQAPTSPPEPSGPPAAEPIDYYALLGLNAEHLLATAPIAATPTPFGTRGGIGGLFDNTYGNYSGGPILPAGPPSPADIDAASLAQQKAILLAPGYSPEERDARVNELEVARRILRDEQRRARYDMLLISFRQGLYDTGRLEALRHLQELARADMAEERGETISSEQAAALLKQGQAYLDARLAREAIEPLRRAVAGLPHEPAAHQAYVQALLTADDPLALGGYALRMALRSLEALQAQRASTTAHTALISLCRGLLARDEGDTARARTELQYAVALDAQLAPAWRGLAALALGRSDLADAVACCQRALAGDPRDERALVMLCAAYLRGRQRNQAREIAVQIAALRGTDDTANTILHELGA